MRGIVCVAIGLLFFGLACAPAPVPKPLPVQPTFKSETDRPGGTYREFELPSANPNDCQSACAADELCKSWSLVYPQAWAQNSKRENEAGTQALAEAENVEHATCKLKSTVVAEIPDVCCVSGLRPPAFSNSKPLSPGEVRRRQKELNERKELELRQLNQELAALSLEEERERQVVEEKSKQLELKAQNAEQELSASLNAVTEKLTSSQTELNQLQLTMQQESEEAQKRREAQAKRQSELNAYINELKSEQSANELSQDKRLAELNLANQSELEQLTKGKQESAEKFERRRAEISDKEKQIGEQHEAEVGKLLQSLRAQDNSLASENENAQTPETESTFVEINTDRPGNDYRTIVLTSPSPRRCRSGCLNDKRCQTWTYVKPGVLGSQARCFLKEGVPAKETSDCCISGTKTKD